MTRPYQIAKLAKPVGDGVSSSYWVELVAVGKKVSADFPYAVANEYVCAKLGSFIGLPVPPFALLNGKGTVDVWFGSLDYRLSGHSLPPIDPAGCYIRFPVLSAGVVLFDIWTANTDRHVKNISMEFHSGKACLNVFDHSHSLLGLEGVPRLSRLMDELAITETAETGANRHCLLDEITDGALLVPWLERIAATPDFLLEDACSAIVSCNVVDQATADKVVEFLAYRRDRLRQIVDGNKLQFQSVTDWSLLI